MSLLDSLKNLATSLLGGSKTYSASNNVNKSVYYPVSGPVSSPASTGLSQSQKNAIAFATVKEKTAQGRAVLAGVGAATLAVVLPATVPAIGTAASSVGKYALSHPIQTAASALVGVPFVGTLISENPKLITELPSKSAAVARSLSDTISDHPVAAGVIGSVAGGVALYEVGKAILGGEDSSVAKTTESNNNAVTPNYAVLTGQTPSTEQQSELTQPRIEPEASIPDAVSTKRRKKRAVKAPVTQTQSQRMNVLINNVALSGKAEKYIKVTN